MAVDSHTSRSSSRDGRPYTLDPWFSSQHQDLGPGFHPHTCLANLGGSKTMVESLVGFRTRVPLRSHLVVGEDVTQADDIKDIRDNIRHMRTEANTAASVNTSQHGQLFSLIRSGEAAHAETDKTVGVQGEQLKTLNREMSVVKKQVNTHNMQVAWGRGAWAVVVVIAGAVSWAIGLVVKALGG